ncbi:MAG: RHS repeat-associated core domain-containing protein, partial [Pseudobdellovibrionaceae bacterium]|nr:RHS repeat-associated core domain-containing protein [Pseudobdellovibrionaceae bacterium]
MITKTVKRFQEDAVEPIHALQAFNGQGQMVASFDENEQLEEGSDESVRAVRALSMRQLNRKNHVVREYVPFQTQFATIEELFAEGFSLDGTGLSYKEFSEVNYDHFDHVVYRKEPTGTKKYIQHFAWGQAETETFRKSRESLLTETVCRVQIGRSDGIYATVDEMGHVHSFNRDAKGRLTAITLAGESQARKVQADSRGLVEMQSIPGIQTEYKVYDSLGRAIGKYVYDRNGAFQHKTEMSYDAASRPVEQKQDGTRSASYFYDRYDASELALLQAQSQDIVPEPKGLPTRIQKVDPNGLYDYELLVGYNRYGKPLARQISIRDRHVSGPDGRHVFVETYDYGPDGTLLVKNDPFGVSSRVRLNANLKVAGVDLSLPWNDEGWQSIIEGIRYNPKGQVNRTDYRGDIRTDLVYETDTLILKDIKSYRQGRLELQDLTLDFDGRLNVVSVKDKLSSQHWGRLNRSSDFVYNARSELVRAEWTRMKPEFGHNTVGPNVHEYSYNAAGNFLINKELSALNWSVDTATSVVPQGPADHSIKYNSMGQLTANGKVLEATYDAGGKMVCARTETQIVHYGYEVSGWRYYKRVLAAVSGDSCSNAASKVAGALSLYPTESATVEPSGKQSFVMVEDMRLARVEHPAGQETEGRWYYYLKDHISSSDVMIHSDGTPVEQMAYRPYGSELDPRNSFAWQQHAAQVQSKKPHERTHHRFTGNYLDDDTGLYYAVNRYYDAETGRFTTPDPLYIDKPDHCQNNTIGCSLYAYADNNPVSKIDPLGLDASNPAEGAGAKVDAFVSDYRSMVNDLTSHQSENLLVLTMPLVGHMVKASDCYFKSVEAFKTGHNAKGLLEAAKAAYQINGIMKEAKGLSMAAEAGAALTVETGPGAVLG